MKNTYENPKLQIDSFDTVDLIALSVIVNDDGIEDGGDASE